MIRSTTARRPRLTLDRLEGREVPAAGLLDPTFGDGGKVFFDNAPQLDVAMATVVQPDGKILVAGYTYPEPSFVGADMVVLRYLPDGTFDPTFGDGGKAVVDINGRIDIGQAMVLQPDGKIVLGGHSYDLVTNQFDVVAVRLTAAGAKDPTFGTGGAAVIDYGRAEEYGHAIALQADGKVLIAGNTRPGGGNFDASVARLTADGQLDPTFGTGGKTTLDYTAGGSAATDAYAVVAQADGTILLGGDAFASPTGPGKQAVYRLTAAGAKDPAFGTNGQTVIDFGGDDRGFAMAVQPDGKVVIGGGTFNGTAADLAVARLTPAGALDAAFGTNGKTTFDLGGADEGIRKLAIQADGKIVAGGSSNAGGAGLDFAATRFTPAGQIDPTFGRDGKTFVDLGTANDRARGMALQADGKIVLAGFAEPAGGSDIAVVRLRADGDFVALAGGVLSVVGTAGADAIQIRQVKKDVEVVINGTSQGIYKGVTAVTVDALGGDDTVELAAAVKAPATLGGGAGNDLLLGNDRDNLLDGGAGSDALFGRGGNDILVGGTGDDFADGGAGSDVLIGGAGRDVLLGAGGADLLIGGATAFDADPTALTAVRAEWAGGGSYARRVANLTGTPGGKNNGNYLTATTVPNDGTADVLLGAGGADLFVASVGDSADPARGETRLDY